MPLEKELALFESIKPELFKYHEEKFVVIRGDEFLGAYDSEENARTEGVRRYGQERFLVKKVKKEKEVA